MNEIVFQEPPAELKPLFESLLELMDSLFGSGIMRATVVEDHVIVSLETTHLDIQVHHKEGEIAILAMRRMLEAYAEIPFCGPIERRDN